jgi:hypothetical protein
MRARDHSEVSDADEKKPRHGLSHQPALGSGGPARHPKTLTEGEQPLLKTVLERCAELRAAAGHVRAFGELLTRLRGQELPGWIAAVRADGLPGLLGCNGLPGVAMGACGVVGDQRGEVLQQGLDRPSVTEPHERRWP